MEEVGERLAGLPARRGNRRKLLGMVGQTQEQHGGQESFGVRRVLSPKINLTTNRHGFSGGSYIATDIVTQSSTIDQDGGQEVKVSAFMQLSPPPSDQSQQLPLTLYSLTAQPEDLTTSTQKLAIGTSRSVSVDVREQFTGHQSAGFFVPESQLQPITPYQNENVSLYIAEKMLQEVQQGSVVLCTSPDSASHFQFQDSEDYVDSPDLNVMVADIDNELQKPQPDGTSEVVKETTADDFLSIRKNIEDFEPVTDVDFQIKEVATPLGVRIRPDIQGQENELGQFNITLKDVGDFKELLLLMRRQAERKTPAVPSSEFHEGRVVFGTNQACQSMLDKSEFLPSQGTHGVILQDRLKPVDGAYSTEQYHEQKYLGKGAFGEVVLCEDKMTKKKFVRKSVGTGYDKREVEVMMNLKHQNITQFYGILHKEGTPEILMEYSGISLLSFTMLSPTMSLVTEEFIWSINRQALSALAYLSIYGIIHLDIKPENICILETDTGWMAKLTDFGSAKLPQSCMNYIGWTAEYMSPEACISFMLSRFPQMAIDNRSDWEVSPKSDVYQWALTVGFMCRKTHILMHTFTNGKDSYRDVANSQQIKLLIIMSMAKDPDMVRKFMIPDDCGPDMKILMHKMLEGSPKARASADELVKEIDNMSKDKLLLDIRKVKAATAPDPDCFIYSPEESTRYIPEPVHHHSANSTTISVSSSVSSVLSHSSNTSVSTTDGGHEFTNQKGRIRARRRVVKRKLRARIASPYPKRETLDNLSADKDLDGNVPDFALLR